MTDRFQDRLLLQVLFNIIYDVLLSAKVKWHALCPVIDSMNHSSASQVGKDVRVSTVCLRMTCSSPARTSRVCVRGIEAGRLVAPRMLVVLK
jgi:hypothetical protein